MCERDFTLVDLPAVLQREPSVIEPGGLEGASENGIEGGLFNVLVSEIVETLCWNFHLQFGCESLLLRSRDEEHCKLFRIGSQEAVVVLGGGGREETKESNELCRQANIGNAYTVLENIWEHKGTTSHSTRFKCIRREM